MKDPFARPVRVEYCRHCHGYGNVVKGYALAKASRRITGAPRGALHVFVVGTAGIYEATEEAVELAKAAKKAVVFDFNGQLVVVRAGDDSVKIARDWWIAAYGCTPEESLANR